MNSEITPLIIKREFLNLLGLSNQREIEIDLIEVECAEAVMQMDVTWVGRGVASCRLERKDLMLSLDDFSRIIVVPMASVMRDLAGQIH